MAAAFDLRVRMLDGRLDQQLIQRIAGRATKRNLRRAGAFIMTTARTSIPRRRGISRPGQPPHAHRARGTGIKAIRFDYIAHTRSVIVGPIKFPGRRGQAPPTLELGGIGSYLDWSPLTNTRSIRRRARFRARPFMVPALHRELRDGRFLAIWRDSIRSR